MSPEISATTQTIEIAIKELEEKSEVQRRLYFEKLIDFFKWTTTIAIAAMLWIGANYNSITNHSDLKISLISFGLAILSSLVFIIVILGWINYELKINTDHLESLKRTASHAVEGEPPQSRNKIILWFQKKYHQIRCSAVNPPPKYILIDELIKKYQKISRILEGGKILTFLHGLFLFVGILFFILSIA